jgi:hypothetical protein
MTAIDAPAGGRADYAVEAEREATEAGMAVHEFRTALQGEPVTTLIPPEPQETLRDYGLRATAEILVRYLTNDGSGTP